MDINLDTFQKNGYVNIGNVLNYDEIQTLKNEVLNNLNDIFRFFKPIKF